MATLQLSPAVGVATRTPKATKRNQAPQAMVPAEKVRAMLREIAFVLHATRAVRRMGNPAPQEDGGTAPAERVR